MFYAVAVGRNVGIYSTWDEARKQVNGYKNAVYKKFKTGEEALEFIKNNHKVFQKENSTVINIDPKDPSTLVAFCDGSALGNGSSNCVAGYACIFPHNRSWDVVQRLSGKATNNRAEFIAGLEAIRRANIEDPEMKKPLFIYSDSMLLIRSITEWLPGWKSSGWIKSNGEEVLNQDLLKAIDGCSGTRTINWTHVKAHTGGTDWFSFWNDVADQQARAICE